MTNINERHKLIPAGYCVLKRGEEVLLSRRFNTGYEDGNYSFPAGHVERSETFATCAVRELFEEVGVRVNEGDLQLSHMMHRYSGQDRVDYRIDVFYVCEKWEGEIKNMEPEKCDDLSWFPMNDLPENTIAYIKTAIHNIQNKIPFSEI